MWRKAGITPHDVNNTLAKCRYDVGLAKVNQNEKAAVFILAKDRVAAFIPLAETSSTDKMILPYEVTLMIGGSSV